MPVGASAPVSGAWAPPSEPEGSGAVRNPHSTNSMIVDEAPLASQQRASRALWSTRVSLLLVAALVGGLAGHFAAPSSTSGGGGVTINEVTAPPGAGSTGGGLSIPKLVQKVLPATVSIDVTGNGEEDQGTGMIISKNGLVVTNNHVIAAAVNGGSITVTRSGTTKSISATLVGTNPDRRRRPDTHRRRLHLPTVTFGNSNACSKRATPSWRSATRWASPQVHQP